MRIAARILFVVLFFSIAFPFFKTPVYAQATDQPQIITAHSSDPSNNTTNNFLTPDVDPNVPQNHHAYTQIVLIDVLSAFMCQLTGIDPTNPKQACLGIDPKTGKVGMPPTQQAQQFGQAPTQPQLGGALGLMTQYISFLYIPAVSTSQYTDYLASNFGIVHHAYAAGGAFTPGGAGGVNCTTSFGYGFCGLGPIFILWTGMRDLSYALLTVLFIAIGIGVMLRFRVDPRTVMTLQNQIPRVVIAILLITFSYAIAGVMIDLMWTATYAGINFISSASPNSQVAISCGPTVMKPINQAAEQTLINQPVSFADMVFNKDCNGIIHSGLFKLAEQVSIAFGDLITQVVQNLLGINLQGRCDLNPFNFNLTGCITGFFLWLTEQIVKLIIVIAVLIALFRLWFELIKSYLTFLIFVIMGPLWIVLGLIPGRPLGFEKWLRIVFANLAVFPLVAFLLVFARVITDAIPVNSNPQNVFIPPFVGNPNVATFTSFMGFGAIMMAPSIPSLIKDRMKATGQGKYGASIAAGVGFAAGAVTSPGKRVWEGLNRRNPTTGAPEGSLAILKTKAWQKTPFLGRKAVEKKQQIHGMAQSGDYRNYRGIFRRRPRPQPGQGGGQGRGGANPSNPTPSTPTPSTPHASTATADAPEREYNMTDFDQPEQTASTTPPPQAPSGRAQKQPRTPLKTKFKEAMYGPEGVIPTQDLRGSKDAPGELNIPLSIHSTDVQAGSC